MGSRSLFLGHASRGWVHGFPVKPPEIFRRYPRYPGFCRGVRCRHEYMDEATYHCRSGNAGRIHSGSRYDNQPVLAAMVTQ